MFVVHFKATFVRQFNKLEPLLQEEVLVRIEQFKGLENHKRLKVHKLHGLLKDCWSFSVNYRYRIVFTYVSRAKKEVALLAIGDHSVYDF